MKTGKSNNLNSSNGEMCGINVVIAPAVYADAEGMYAVERECFSSPWSLDSFRSEMGNKMAHYFVARQGDEIVGYAGAWYIAEEMHITNIAVAPDWQGSGIGRKLTSHLIKHGQESGIREFTLEVMVTNERAVSVYRSLGFEIDGVRKGYYQPEGIDAYIMWRRDGLQRK